MSTPERDAKDALDLAGLTETDLSDATGAMTALPDAATMSRWANEMFKAIPGLADAGAMDTAAIPGVALVAPAAIPGDASLRALSGSAPAGTARRGAAAPSVPLPSTSDPATFASMGALPGAALPGSPWTSGALPNETSVRALPSAMPMSVPSMKEPMAFAGAPTMPSATPRAGAVPDEASMRAFAGSAPAGTPWPGAAPPSFPLPSTSDPATFAGVGAPGMALPGIPWTSPGLPNETAFRALTASLPMSPMPGATMPSFPLPSTTSDPLALAATGGAPTAIPGLPSAGVMPASVAPAFYFLDTLDPMRAPTSTAAIPATGTASKGASVPSNAPAVESYSFLPDLIPQITAPGGLFDAASLRRDFPILDERVNGKRLIWLDNAATTQKPRVVIDRISHFYEHENSNIHRAAHALAARATDAYEAARESARRFLNAGSTREIVFVRGATEGVNLVSQSYGRRHVEKGDEIVITWIEHHSNIVPWQLLCAEKGARLRVAPVDDRGQVLLDAYEKLLNSRTKIVAITHVSNALGTIVPVREMTAMAHRHGARVLVDGAQAVSHMQVDVQAIDCDWYVFSGHKVFGPTGIGVVRGKSDALDLSPPWQGGGNMISDVTFEKTVYQPPPMRFEAGTGNIADAVGLGAALDYVSLIGMDNIARHEHELLEYATKRLVAIPGLRMIGTAAEKAGVASFVIDGFRTDEIGEALNRDGIAVRTGHHCAQPALRRFGLEQSVRPSLALYNTCEDIDALIDSLERLVATRGRRSSERS